ncbi:receptor-type tyrosine-protein phosphatase N2 [Neomonachus schauinslandi]|uniref:Receptor-type tyrosine-protein phosphatase N2 n=1 Tax=Neomonachus schauinslandi TaxID=29088 RepID=A0A8M1MTC6_NEOSC|nr:receptor-type tyrosine-protein phosphatase N2 [Neomonachus schauinslandi]
MVLWLLWLLPTEHVPLYSVSQSCVNNGVFGRCQEVPAVAVDRHEVSPLVLQHLTATLQKLSRTGFTWQDDYTQHVMAQELSTLPHTYPQHLEASDTARSSKLSVDKERRYSLEDDSALAEAVQRYLPYLEALSWAASNPLASWGHLIRKPVDNPTAVYFVTSRKHILINVLVSAAFRLWDKREKMFCERSPELGTPLVFVMPLGEVTVAIVAQVAIWMGMLLLMPLQGQDPRADGVLTFMAQTSALTYAPGPRADHPGGRPLRTRSRLRPDELSPKVDGGANRQSLVTSLGTSAARKPPAPHGEGDPGPQNPLRTPWRTARVLSAPAALRKWPSSPGDPEDPPAFSDEALIRSLLKDLGKQPVEGLSPLGLGEMAHVIATSVRGVDAEGELQGAEKGAAGKPREANPGKQGGDGTADDWGPDGEGGVYKEVSRLSLQLGDHLQDPGSRLFPATPLLMEPFKTEMKKSETPRMPPAWEEESAGVEDVRSQTYSKERLEGLPPSEPRAGGFGEFQTWVPGPSQEDARLGAGAQGRPSEGLRLEVRPSQEEEGYIVTGDDPLSPEKGKELMESIARLLEVPMSVFPDIAVLGPAVTFRVSASVQNLTTADVVQATVDNKDKLEKASGLKILHAGSGSKSKLKLLPHGAEQEDSTPFIVLTLVSVVAMVGVLLASGVIYCLRHTSHSRLQEKLSDLGEHPGPDATNAYQELCRQRMAVRTSERPEAPHASRINSVSSQFSDGPLPSPSARSSTSSWSEEPVQSNMDISTGHMVLAYMEDHLKNKNRLEKEWEALCVYQAEPNSSLVAQREENVLKNRSPAVLTYDHSRILLKSENSHSNSDYINASPIVSTSCRGPHPSSSTSLRGLSRAIGLDRLASQRENPLQPTAGMNPMGERAGVGVRAPEGDESEMVWERGCVVIVMLTPLSENGIRQCYHYWPDEGSNLYHVYEVNLVSEHIWCEDFLVRSFYLKNLQTNETRTVTQFHFLSWYDQGVPSSARSLLDFRRKVNKCYRGRSCPIIVHCSDGAGRSGTYVLIDMVLNKMAKGAKEIDIAATLEHLRDQRPGMVQTKEQFEFALTAVAEEVNAILRALPQ